VPVLRPFKQIYRHTEFASLLTFQYLVPWLHLGIALTLLMCCGHVTAVREVAVRKMLYGWMYGNPSCNWWPYRSVTCFLQQPCRFQSGTAVACANGLERQCNTAMRGMSMGCLFFFFFFYWAYTILLPLWNTYSSSCTHYVHYTHKLCVSPTQCNLLCFIHEVFVLFGCYMVDW
jgi:hypothetical protein